MKKSIIKLSEYIDSIDKQNKDNPVIAARLNFFYSEKYKNLLVMKKSVSFQKDCPKTSTTTIRDVRLENMLRKYNLRKFSLEDRQEFILENAKHMLIDPDYESAIGGMLTTIMDEDSKPYVNLDELDVLRQYRNKGVATTLINELKNSTVNNGLSDIKGSFTPLDVKGFVYSYVHTETPIHYQIINYLAHKFGILKKYSFIDKNALAEIYDKLGFTLDNMTDRHLSMHVDQSSIPTDKKLPDEFTKYAKNTNTFIIQT